MIYYEIREKIEYISSHNNRTELMTDYDDERS